MSDWRKDVTDLCGDSRLATLLLHAKDRDWGIEVDNILRGPDGGIDHELCDRWTASVAIPNAENPWRIECIASGKTIREALARGVLSAHKALGGSAAWRRKDPAHE